MLNVLSYSGQGKSSFYYLAHEYSLTINLKLFSILIHQQPLASPDSSFLCNTDRHPSTYPNHKHWIFLRGPPLLVHFVPWEPMNVGVLGGKGLIKIIVFHCQHSDIFSRPESGLVAISGLGDSTHFSCHVAL
ncbi:hypothetical protein HJG60_011890 [Phyllostomus discolor]|uniref:Uncharacterized protein n=1 Tax=Phyllostomus discolor TaxID=89673 RepID=A0A833ZLC3_9CHIR|nr:hypothetical protein HJG60_011890 [Phyllostomus discolor]